MHVFIFKNEFGDVAVAEAYSIEQALKLIGSNWEAGHVIYSKMLKVTGGEGRVVLN